MPFFLNSDVNPDIAPDRIESVGAEVPPNFIVSRYKDGSICSIFSDPVWDMRAYGPKTKFNFTSWHKGSTDELSDYLSHEIRTITWLAMFNPGTSRKLKKPSSFYTFVSTLRALAKIAYYFDVKLSEAHANTGFQVALKASLAATSGDRNAKLAPTYLKTVLITSYLSINHRECTELARWRIVPEEDYDNWMARLNSAAQDERESYKKTPLVPTRILAALITGIEKELDTVTPHLGNLVAFFEALYTNPSLFCDTSKQVQKNKNRIAATGRPFPQQVVRKFDRVTRKETLERFHLYHFFQTEAVQPNLNAIPKYLWKMGALASVLIYLFTGMRSSEMQVMPYNCYRKIDVPDFGEVSVIFSHTKKLAPTHYSSILPWVTSPITSKAIQVAQACARINWIRNTSASFPDDQETVPLWLSTLWKRTDQAVHYDYPTGTFASDLRSVIGDLEGTQIEQSDIDELVAFDAFREWDEDPEFAIGNVWPFASHQARRSVAVYASRSGIVSLPSLATQYKHLSLTMTALYSENSGFAESFIINEDGSIPEEFGVLADFRDAKRFNASVAFEEQVIKSQSKLLGGRGKAFQDSKDLSFPAFLESSKTIKEQIKTGQTRYVPLATGGGCMRESGPCDSYGLDWTMPCFGCSDSVFDDNALRAAAESLADAMEEMSPKSLAYQFSNERLTFIKARLTK